MKTKRIKRCVCCNKDIVVMAGQKYCNSCSLNIKSLKVKITALKRRLKELKGKKFKGLDGKTPKDLRWL
jgi:hypothetical protein